MSYRFDKVLSRPDRVFRVAGLVTCAITGLNTIFVHLYGTPNTDMLGLLDVIRVSAGWEVSRSTLITIDLLVFTLFGVAFWRNLDSVRLLNPGRLSVALLALQSILGLLFSTALFFIVAAELCFILSNRTALIWVLAQMVAGVALVLVMPTESLLQFTSGANAPPPAVTLLMQCLMYPMILSFSYCLGLLAATEWKHRRELARVNAELKATQELQAESVRLAERLYISRELHDALGHHLAALSVNLQLASRQTTGEAAWPVREAHLIARTLLADVREVVSTMRHESTIDLRGALETLAAGIKSPVIHCEVPETVRGVDPLQAHTLFRCVQEIVTNAIRHAGAHNLWLTLTRDPSGLSLFARDDGRGADGLKLGNGLRGMRERVEEYGGTLSIESEGSGGFAVRIRLPAAGGA